MASASIPHTEETLGIYISIPFCRAKCSFCNFSSGVFGPELIAAYLVRLQQEIAGARAFASRLGAPLPEHVDSVYFGGGTPSLFAPEQVEHVLSALRGQFAIDPAAEFTVECAPGQLEDATLAAFERAGLNRISLGVQSFVDRESAAVGRQHTAAECRAEIARLARAGVPRIGLDLIAGLPHQTEASWRHSLAEAVVSGVDNVSVYMLEVDEGSRLGREALAGGQRYGAAGLPGPDQVADSYTLAAETLTAAGLPQYEISNFGRIRSRHNTRYWLREPYLGFGLEAHSMLRCGTGGVRCANSGEMIPYLATGLGACGWERMVDPVGHEAAFEETLFLGLRLVEGVDLNAIRRDFGPLVDTLDLDPMIDAGLLARREHRLWLTRAGRMASNEVFERLLLN